MTKDEVFEAIKRIAVQVAERSGRELDPDQIKITSRFIEDLGFSSIAILELIMAIEEEFDLDEIPESDIEKVQTVELAIIYLLDAIG